MKLGTTGKDRKRIVEMAEMGMKADEIARTLGIRVEAINGALKATKKPARRGRRKKVEEEPTDFT